jgi:hypothetical protein
LLPGSSINATGGTLQLLFACSMRAVLRNTLDA